MISLISKTLPNFLKEGDEIITIASSSAVENEENLVKGTEVLTSWGLVCLPQKIQGRRWGYLAGDDNERFKELHQNFPPPLIICARGGWGAARLLERPGEWSKGWILGFSDASSLLLARLNAGFHGCIHGPLLITLGNEPLWSQNRLKAILFGEEIPDIEGDPWVKGSAIGPLVVTNLTVATHLIGSKHFPNLNGAILVLEDIGEAPYRIDRMLTQWRLSGLLQQLAGIGFGSFIDCEEKDEVPRENTFRLTEILKERTSDLGIPVLGNLPLGHSSGNASFPLGAKTLLDANLGLLRFLTYY